MNNEVKKTIVFICDLYGTFIGTEDNLLTSMEYENFVLNLEKLRIKNNADEVIFSFMSTSNSCKEIIEQLEILNYFIKTNNIKIKFGKQFFENNSFKMNENQFLIITEQKHKTKAQKIIEYTEYLKEKREINFLCFADDSNQEQMLFDMLEVGKKLDIEYQQFCPKGSQNDFFQKNDSIIFSNSDGIEGLNVCLLKYLLINNKVLSK